MLWLASLAFAAPIEVEADPTYETLSVIAYLAAYDEFLRNENKAYVAAVEAHFRPHADHPAVAMARKLRGSHSIGYNALSGLAAHVSEDFEPIAPLTPFPERLDDRWKDEEATARFLEAAAGFAEDADFDTFWSAQQPYVDAVEARFRSRLADKDVVGWFDTTFGPAEGAHYRVVPGMLTGQNNYGTSVARPDGTVSYRPALGLWSLDDDGLPTVGRAYELILVHEFGHAYGNPAVNAHLATLGPTGDALYALDPQTMDRQAYPGGELVLGETLTRAFTVLYAHDRYGEDAGTAQLHEEEGRGFRWTGAVTAVLDAQRKAGPLDIDILAPDLRDAMKAWLADPPRTPFRGVINDGQSGPWLDDMVLAAPPASTTAGAYARVVHKQFFAKKGIALVEASLHDPTAHQAVIAYGTPADNPMVARVFDHYGWTLTSTQLAIGPRRYTLEPGDHGVVFIAAVPHPDHPDLPVVVYSATSDAAMDDINAMFHGPTQWIVGEALAGKAPRPIANGSLTELE